MDEAAGKSFRRGCGEEKTAAKGCEMRALSTKTETKAGLSRAQDVNTGSKLHDIVIRHWE